MQPFSEHPACPKCGNNRAATVYHTGTVRLRNNMLACQCGEEIDGEHLQRTCERCGYVWAEACLDPRLADCREDRHRYAAEGVLGWPADGWNHSCLVPGCGAGLVTPYRELPPPQGFYAVTP